MVKAYHDAHSPKAKEPVSEAKVGVRDCTQALCHMEAELEANLGAFVLKIEGELLYLLFIIMHLEMLYVVQLCHSVYKKIRYI